MLNICTLVKVVKPNGDTVEYTYDGEGKRYSKTVNGTARYYHYDAEGNIVSETNSNKEVLVKYIRDNSGKAISMIQGSNTYYFLYNSHGDVTSLTDEQGTTVATYFYDEFGNLTSSTGTIYNPLRYAGGYNAYFDSETNLYKMGVRYYSSETGRWITRDTDKGEKNQPSLFNKYAYTLNNPVTNVDPTGNRGLAAKKHMKRVSIYNNYMDVAYITLTRLVLNYILEIQWPICLGKTCLRLY